MMKMIEKENEDLIDNNEDDVEIIVSKIEEVSVIVIIGFRIRKIDLSRKMLKKGRREFGVEKDGGNLSGKKEKEVLIEDGKMIVIGEIDE